MEEYFLLQRLKSAYQSCKEAIDKSEKQLTKNLIEAGIITRQAQSNGLWCSILLPAILINYSLMYTVSHTYIIVAFVSIGLLCHMTLFAVFVSVSSLVLKESTFAGCTASSMLPALLIYTFLQDNLIKSLLLGAVPVVSNFYLLIYLLRKFPNTFTLGEAMIVSQSYVLFGCIGLADSLTGFGTDFVNVTIFILVFASQCVIYILSKLPEEDKTISNLASILLVFGGVALVLLHAVLGRYFLFDFFCFVFQSKRAHMIGLWVSLVVLAVLVLYTSSSREQKAGTAMRKVFHLLAAAVFLTGVLGDVDFLKMACGIVFSILTFVEALRKSRIQPIAGALQTAFETYCDEKDRGCLAVTPLYLFAGLSGPLSLVPPHEGYQLELLSGVLAIGIGDSAASCVGSRFGRFKWPNTEKTIEGSVAMAVSQVLTVYLLIYFDLLNTSSALLRTTVAALVSTYVEAHTVQVDNIVLPLVTLLSFQCTWFL